MLAMNCHSDETISRVFASASAEQIVHKRFYARVCSEFFNRLLSYWLRVWWLLIRTSAVHPTDYSAGAFVFAVRAKISEYEGTVLS